MGEHLIRQPQNFQEMATHQISRQKKGGLGVAFYTASNIAGSYRPEPEPAAPASAKSKPRNRLLSRKPPSSRLEIKQVNSEERIGVAAEEGGGGGGRRRGVTVEEARRSVSQVETNLASVVAFLQVKVMVTDMPGFMQVHAFRCARRTYDSLEKFSSKHMAFNIKKVTKAFVHTYTYTYIHIRISLPTYTAKSVALDE